MGRITGVPGGDPAPDSDQVTKKYVDQQKHIQNKGDNMTTANTPHPEFFFRAYHLGKDYLTEEEKEKILSIIAFDDEGMELNDDDDDYNNDSDGVLEQEISYYNLYEVIVKARTPAHAAEVFKKFYPASKEEKQKLQTEYKIIETKYDSLDAIGERFHDRECFVDYQEMARDLTDEDFYSRGYSEWYYGDGKEEWEANDEDYDESFYTLKDNFENVPANFIDPALLPYLTEEQRASLGLT